MEVEVWKLGSFQVIGLACFGVVIGIWLKKQIPVLDRLNIPACIVGGMVYALATLALRDRYLNLEMDTVLRDILMVLFFTTIGMSASLRVAVQGGRQVLLFFAVATLGLTLQNLLGVAVALAVGLDPLIGLIAGSVALAGGPATAIAFGSTFEGLGVSAATTLGIASAIFGILSGGLLSGFIGGALIRRRGLAIPGGAGGAPGKTLADEVAYAGDAAGPPVSRMAEERETEHASWLNNVIALGIAMGVGTLVSGALENLGMVLPGYIGAMICAGAIRNLDDKIRFVGISQHHMDEIGNISLNLFIVMALLTLRLWELVHLAVPVLLILCGQVILAMALCWMLVFRVMGSDREAAVMSGGYSGFMLGTTANAIACMSELTSKYGPAPHAFLVVSLVGAFLIDFTNALVITQFINVLR